jgi:hypothetical protein
VPGPRPANAALLQALLGAGLYDDAVAELRRVQREGGSSPLVEATIAYALNRQGELRPAIQAMRRAYPQFMAAGGERLPREILTVIFPLSYWDLIQTYDPVSDDMIAVGAPGSYQSLYCWKSGSTLFSTLTSAPRAKYVASYDNYLVALNVRDPASATSLYVQRVQWSDRGNPSNWTAGLSGFEDLLDMKGQGTRIISDGRRMVIFSDLEIWQGVTANAPFQFVFSAIDRSVGCPYPWSVCQTPAGIVFLGTGSRPYLLPTDGGELQPIGDSVRPYIQSFVNFGVSTDRIWSVYDPYFNTWRLFLHASGQDYPGGGLLYDMGTQEWFTQQYTSYLDAAGANPTAKSFYLTRGWIGRGDTNSSGTVWSASGFSGSYTWDNVPGLWQQMAPATAYGPRTVFMGTSTGTIMRERPDAGVYPADIMDSSLNTIYASWTGRAVAGEHAEGGKAISRVAVVFGAGSATSMRIALGASRQTLALPSTSARGQRSTSFHYIARDPRINLFANPWRVPISRLIVTYREGDDGVYSDADF